MDEEFLKAFNELKADPQPIYLVLPKAEAWLLLTPIQLASKHSHSKESYVIKKATKIGRAIQTLIVGDSKTLAEVANAGWVGKEPRVSAQKFKAEMARAQIKEINLTLTKEEVWCLVATIQLAHRHPEYQNTRAARYCKDLLDQLATAIPEGILSTLVKAGWDTRLDQPIQKKGFG